MVEVTKPDYLSLVNQGGSGFNVSELVTAMVAAEIEPKRSIQNTKLEKTENSISGIGYLNSQALITKDSFDEITGANFFDVTSSNSSSVSLVITDETQLSTSNRTISNIQIAKKMVFELGGFSSISGPLEGSGVTIDIDFGTWTENNSDNFSFSEASDNETQTVSFTSKSLTDVAALFNDIDGVSAEIVDTTGDGTNYSLVLSSENTGAENGFRLSETGGSKRWETTLIPNSTTEDNTFNQLATDAMFSLDGVQVSRSGNTITDIMTGIELTLNADVSGDIAVSTSRSNSQIRQTVEDTIASLNEFKDEIDRLTYVDIEGEGNGPLTLETSATMLKSNFKRLAIEPLQGFDTNSIYLSQLGIKTNSEGQYYLDEAIFEKTLSANPEYFSALKDDNLSTSTSSASVSTSAVTEIPSGRYTVDYDGSNWKFGDTILTSDGAGTFTSTTYPGLRIETIDASPAQFDVYVGKSFASKISDLMSDTLADDSSLKSAETAYQNLTEDINERLEKLDLREELISTRYTEQFGAMESAMTQFNSTKTMLENFIEAWKKQK
jgi:flagellar hook-associated protein 2